MESRESVQYVYGVAVEEANIALDEAITESEETLQEAYDAYDGAINEAAEWLEDALVEIEEDESSANLPILNIYETEEYLDEETIRFALNVIDEAILQREEIFDELEGDRHWKSGFTEGMCRAANLLADMIEEDEEEEEDKERIVWAESKW